MRCDEVRHELSAPTGRLDPSALAGHLEDCGSCAEFAERASWLDDVWEATRPSEPTAFVADRIWANVSRAVESGAAGPVVLPMTPASWRRTAAWLAPLAALAAAVLLAVLPMLRGGDPVEHDRADHGGPVIAQGEPGDDAGALAMVEIEPGVVTIIPMDGGELVEKSQLIVSETQPVSPTNDIFNEMESQSPNLELLSSLQ